MRYWGYQSDISTFVRLLLLFQPLSSSQFQCADGPFAFVLGLTACSHTHGSYGEQPGQLGQQEQRERQHEATSCYLS